MQLNKGKLDDHNKRCREILSLPIWRNALWQKNLLLWVCSTKTSLQRFQARKRLSISKIYKFVSILINWKMFRTKFIWNNFVKQLKNVYNTYGALWLCFHARWLVNWKALTCKLEWVTIFRASTDRSMYLLPPKSQLGIWNRKCWWVFCYRRQRLQFYVFTLDQWFSTLEAWRPTKD